MKKQKFMTWLLQQGDRRNRVGDLARDFLEDNSCPNANSSISKIKEYLELQDASFDCLASFDEAVKAYNGELKCSLEQHTKNGEILARMSHDIFALYKSHIYTFGGNPVHRFKIDGCFRQLIDIHSCLRHNLEEIMANDHPDKWETTTYYGEGTTSMEIIQLK